MFFIKNIIYVRKRGAFIMEEKKKNIVLSEDDRLKYEIAEEIGLGEKVAEYGWKSLTSKESGKIGGIMAARRRKQVKNKL